MLFENEKIDRTFIITPSGVRFETSVLDIMLTKENGNNLSANVSCAVKKPESDDPDVTAGMLIYARASFDDKTHGLERVIITGGIGIGKVTKPGLDRPVGDYAINSVPRKMITRRSMLMMSHGIHWNTLMRSLIMPMSVTIR